MEQIDAVFEQQMLPHRDAILRYALRLTENVEDARDLVQDTYVKAWRFRNGFEAGSNARAWLFTLCKHSFINDYRKNAKQPERVAYDQVSDFIELMRDKQASSGVCQTDVDDFSDEVVRALSQIPEQHRQIIKLSDIDGLTYEEMSELLHIPIGTVRSRLNRARLSLQSLLRDYADSVGCVRHDRFEERAESILAEANIAA